MYCCSSWRRSNLGLADGTVLIVDDEPVLLRGLVALLSRRGYAVFRAGGACKALAILESQVPIDVLLSDVILPEMRGTELVKECFRIAPSTACVLMTAGFLDQSEVPTSVPVLRKPFSKTELFAVVDAAIARSARLRAQRQRMMEEAASR